MHKRETSGASSSKQPNAEQRLTSRTRRALLILCIFVGAGALFGGIMAFVLPDFMGAPLLLPILQKIPFVGPYITSLALPALALLLFVFAPHTIAVLQLVRKSARQYTGSIICGAFLVAFTIGEMIFIPNPASVLFLLFGIAEIVLSIICLNDSKDRLPT